MTSDVQLGRSVLESKERTELQAIAEQLSPFVARGLAQVTLGAAGATRLTILPSGLPYARTIAALFDPYRQQGDRRFSSAV